LLNAGRRTHDPSGDHRYFELQRHLTLRDRLQCLFGEQIVKVERPDITPRIPQSAPEITDMFNDEPNVPRHIIDEFLNAFPTGRPFAKIHFK
jgi:hypothetical protein